jgi:DNA-binding NarL/FixJ family response regulator
LSEREREIADGVREGSSNIEIAKRLGLSVKTIEYHLSRIYARFGFRSRAQLAALVEREGRR